MDKVLTSGQFTQSTFSLWLRDGKSGGSPSVTFQLHPFGDDLAISCLLLGSRFISGAPFLRSKAGGGNVRIRKTSLSPLLLAFRARNAKLRNWTGFSFGNQRWGENCSFFFSRFFLLAFITSMASYRKATFVIEPMEENLNLSGHLLTHE